MAFRELVGVVARNPRVFRIDQRGDGQLHRAGPLYHPVEQFQFQRVDQVLGVMEDNCLGGPVARRFVCRQRGVEAIEAIGLCCRSVGIDFDGDDARVGNAVDCRLGRGIVAVMADEQTVIAMFKPVERGPQHRGITAASSQAGMNTASQPGRAAAGMVPAKALGKRE